MNLNGFWGGVLLRAIYFTLGFLVAIAGLLFMAANAEAGTLKGNTEQCMWFAQIGREMAETRDAGMQWDEALADINEKIAEAMGVKGSLVQDEADAVLIRELSSKIWHEWKDAAPVDAGMNVLLACVQPQAKQRIKVVI